MSECVCPRESPHRECYTISIIYSNVLTTSNAGVVLLHGFTSLAAPGHSLRLGLVACALRPDNYSTSGRSLYPMTSSSAGLDRSEERPPRYARTLTHAHTHSSKDRENVENVIRTMRHGAYPHPPLAPRDSPSRTLSLLLLNSVTFPLPQSSFISRAFHVFPFCCV